MTDTTNKIDGEPSNKITKRFEGPIYEEFLKNWHLISKNLTVMI